MVWILGETVSQSIYTGNTGETFTRVASYINGTVAVWNPTITELGSGYYRWSYVPAVAGSFEWSGTGSAGSPLPINFDVEATGVIEVGGPGPATSGITRKQLRRDALSDIGDLMVLTATADGSDVTFVDQINLTGGIMIYAGRDVLFTDGTVANLGEERYVRSSSADQRAISFGYALPADTALGDECEMINARGLGFKFQDANRAIDQVVREIAEDAAIPADSETATFANGSALSVPAEFYAVDTVQYLTNNGEIDIWHRIDKAPRPNGHGWWLDRENGEVNITGSLGRAVDGYSVKISGRQRLAPPAADSDRIPVDTAYLVLAVQARLARMRHMKMHTPELERMAYLLSQQAEKYRARIITRTTSFAEIL